MKSKKKSKSIKKSGRKTRTFKKPAKVKKPKKVSRRKRKIVKIKKSDLNKLIKRRGREIYDIHLKPGRKAKSEIDKVLDNIKIKIKGGELPENFVKLTFVARHKKDFSSISHIYELDEVEQIKESLTEILDSIYSKITPRSTRSIKKISKLKQFLNRIIIDFETAI